MAHLVRCVQVLGECSWQLGCCPDAADARREAAVGQAEGPWHAGGAVEDARGGAAKASAAPAGYVPAAGNAAGEARLLGSGWPGVRAAELDLGLRGGQAVCFKPICNGVLNPMQTSNSYSTGRFPNRTCTASSNWRSSGLGGDPCGEQPWAK